MANKILTLDNVAEIKQLVDEAGGSIDIVQETGTSTTSVMSQNAVTKELEGKADKITPIVINTWCRIEGNNQVVAVESYAEDIIVPSGQYMGICKMTISAATATTNDLRVTVKISEGKNYPGISAVIDLNKGFINANGKELFTVMSGALSTQKTYRLYAIVPVGLKLEFIGFTVYRMSDYS